MNLQKKKILCISGSTKSRSTSLSFLQYIAHYFEGSLEVEIYNNIGELPHFNPELDHENLPKKVKCFRKKIEIADAVLFCSPEYVFSLPGSLKNAIEWTVSTTLFSNKPVAIIIAATVGEKAFESLGLIMTTIEAIVAETSKLLVKGAKGKLSPDGKINDEKTRKQIQKVVKSLIKTTDSKDKRSTKYR